MPPKLVALIVAAALTTGWLLASIVSPPVAKLQGLPERVERRAPPRESEHDAPFIEQLQLKLQSVPVAPVPRRNPFVFGGATRRAARDVMPMPEADSLSREAATAPVVTGPSLRLSGIGSTSSKTGTTLTAIISDGTTVHLASVGETVMGYRVIAISDDSVTIENASGAQWQLRLR